MDKLDVLRGAETLVWVQATVFRPGYGDDGNLVGDDVSIALDTFLRDHDHDTNEWNPKYEQGIAVMDPPKSLADTQGAVRAWCREFLGRDDVQFDDDADVEAEWARDEAAA